MTTTTSEIDKKRNISRLPKKENDVSAEDAIVSIEMSSDELKVTLTMAPEWEFILPQTDGDDPGCVIVWDCANCFATVKAFNAAIANGEAPPPWLNALNAGPITVLGLQMAILNRVRVQGAGGVVGNSIIAPNSVEQYTGICTRLFAVGTIPIFMNHAVCPIGRNYILLDRIHHNTAVASPIEAPSGLGVAGVAVFA
jgi:hypothetical protein